MRADITDADALGSLPLSAVLGYLQARGWKPGEHWADRGVVFRQANDGAPVEVLVPVRETFADYWRGVAEVLRVLERAEGRSQLSIYADISAVGADVITISARGGAPGYPPRLHAARHLVADAFGLMAVAGRTAEQRRPVYLGSRTAEVNQYLQTLRLAPTSFESGELIVHSPVPPVFGQAGSSNGKVAEPLARRATRVLAESLRALERGIVEAAVSRDPEHLASAVDDGVSANLCESVSSICERVADSGGMAEFDISWAEQSSLPSLSPCRIKFSPNSRHLLRGAAAVLREREPYRDQQFTADVVHLSRESDVPFAGHAVLIIDLRGSSAAADVVFAPDDRECVIEAFEQGELIEVSGDLSHQKRRWHLENPRNVRIVPNSAP